MVEIENYDVIVIGGGAAGMMAAGTAAADGKKVALLEKMEKPGRKIRITGKGRCNLTNIKPEEEFLEKIQANREFFLPAYKEFSNNNLVRFFKKNGVPLETEQGGRVFPKSGKAWDIANALAEWCVDNGVTLMCNTTVDSIMTFNGRIRGVTYRNKKGFQRRMEAPAVILATGGASYPATGSTGDGYKFAHRLGHTIVPVRPSLVPLESDYAELPYMKGLHLKNVSVKLLVDGETACEEFGEMSVSARGLEGAVILRMSRTAVDALIDNKKVEAMIDLKPALDAETLRARIDRELAELSLDAPTSDLLRKLVPKELVTPIAKIAGSHSKRPLSEFGAEKVGRLIKALKEFRISISDYRPFEEAIITAGGVSVDEINPETMESRIIPGLYLAGELVDIDANTGGYNLQVAFSTGRLAGRLKHKE